MGTFWAIVIGAIFVLAIVGLLVFGGRYLRVEEHAHEGKGRLDTSKDKEARDRREHRMNTDEQGGSNVATGESRGGNVRVYRH